MPEEKKSFWTTLPGILTGIAAVITAVGGLYQIIKPSEITPTQPDDTYKQAPRTPGDPPKKESNPFEWPLVGRENFFAPLSGWKIGIFPDKYTPKAQFKVVAGKYVWNLDFKGLSDRYVIAPYGPATDLFVAVDVRVRQLSSLPASTNLVFGFAEERGYAFRVNSSKRFELVKYDGNRTTVLMRLPLPGEFDPSKTNRIAVSVDQNKMRVYLNSKRVGEYKDSAYSGGKVGLEVSGDKGTKVVVEFSDFEFRRKAQ